MAATGTTAFSVLPAVSGCGRLAGRSSILPFPCSVLISTGLDSLLRCSASPRSCALCMVRTMWQPLGMSGTWSMSQCWRQNFSLLPGSVLPAFSQCLARALWHGHPAEQQTLPGGPKPWAVSTPGFAPVLEAELQPYARQRSASVLPAFCQRCGTPHGQLGRQLTCRLSCAPGLCLPRALRRCLGCHWAPCRTSTRRRLLPFDVLLGVPAETSVQSVDKEVRSMLGSTVPLF